MEPWQRAIALREANRLLTFIRRWRWQLLARTRSATLDRLRK